MRKWQISGNIHGSRDRKDIRHTKRKGEPVCKGQDKVRRDMEFSDLRVSKEERRNMFLKHQIFKSLINKAWKNESLTVVDMENRWYISGYAWAAIIDKQVMPNKTLAAIIELTGEMPRDGAGFTAGKNATCQYELKEAAVIDLYQKLDVALVEMKATPIIIQKEFKDCRLLQNTSTGNIKLINSVFTDMVSAEEIDHEKEASPDGPFCSEKEPYLMLWTNGNCVFGAYTLSDPDQGSDEWLILQELEKLELPLVR